MKKKIITFLLIITCIMFISPINTRALEVSNTNMIFQNTSNLITDSIYVATDECAPTSAPLGDPDCESSVAWLVQLLLNVIKIAGPILVILLSSIDFIVVIVKSDNDQFGKAQKKLITRLVLALLLFVLPVIVEVLLQVFGITGSATAGIN